MFGVDQVTSPILKKQQRLLSSAMKRTSEWICSQDVPSDIKVQAGESSFSLHKPPLASKCGYIKKLISEASDSTISLIEIPDVPGGAQAFELVAKFCYGLNFEITIENVAMLRCAAEYLEMTEDYEVGNLISTTEAYLEEVALMNLSGAVTVLHKSESLLPMAEKIKLVNRCIDAVSYITCSDNQFYLSSRAENSHESISSSSASQPKAIVHWWAEELMVLRIDTFQRLIIAMKARGFKEYALGPVIMLYVQKSLRGLDIFGRGGQKIEPKQEHEKRIILETIVSLLPRERNAMSIRFLSMLLRAALYLETTVACRLDLEKRMAFQLRRAVLDDLLIPSFSSNSEALFDVDTVQRILTNYLDHELEGRRLGYSTDDDCISPPPSDIEQVGRLMESYLAEIASDQKLTIEKFVSLGELIPEQARITEDGMYRAIDIYLKAHPSLSDMERKRVCSLMDCQRLSREACAHAAQNDRLPVQTVVQVLYCEQRRLQDTTNGNFTFNFTGGGSPALSYKGNYSYATRHDNDELSRLQRENDGLKVELLRMKMQVNDLGNPSGNLTSADKPPLPKKSFISSVSKRLGRLSPFLRLDSVKPTKTRSKPPKDRRHSIS